MDGYQSDGPMINHERTTINRYSNAQLRVYNDLAGLQQLVNMAYSVSDADIFPPFNRLKSLEQMTDELGKTSFTFIISSATTENGKPPRSYATISADRAIHDGPSGPDPANVWKTPFREDPGRVEGWEVHLLAVDPTIQRQGLGKLLLALMEAEVERVFEAGRLSDIQIFSEGSAREKEGEAKDEGARVKECHILLTTIKEKNLSFYSKSGYKPKSERGIEKGTRGCLKSFTNVHMRKVLKASE